MPLRGDWRVWAMSPVLLRGGFRVARKQHHCGMCNAAIAAGERHHVSTNVFDSRVYDWRTCGACSRDGITAEVYFWAGSPDEGVGFDSASEWAHDHRDAVAEGSIARDWLARSGCKCERCEVETCP